MKSCLFIGEEWPLEVWGGGSRSAAGVLLECFAGGEDMEVTRPGGEQLGTTK